MGVRSLRSVDAARGGSGWVSLRSAGMYALGLWVAAAAGCAPAQPVAVQRLLAHQAMLDFAGLGSPQTVPQLNIVCRVPHGWDALPLQSGPLYRHQQWRSPSHNSGVGVATVRLPIPLSAKWILWFAKVQYAKRQGNSAPDGALLAQWTDTCGREWFEAENDRYHVTGFAVTSGCNAWIVYSGYRRRAPFDPWEEGLAARSMDTILPLALVGQLPTGSVASAATVK